MIQWIRGSGLVGMVVLVLNHFEHLPAQVVQTDSSQPGRLVHAHTLRLIVLDVGMPNGSNPSEHGHFRGEVFVTIQFHLVFGSVDRFLTFGLNVYDSPA
jgi:hypothetical protein